jgi:hypothetical protein
VHTWTSAGARSAVVAAAMLAMMMRRTLTMRRNSTTATMDTEEEEDDDDKRQRIKTTMNSEDDDAESSSPPTTSPPQHQQQQQRQQRQQQRRRHNATTSAAHDARHINAVLLQGIHHPGDLFPKRCRGGGAASHATLRVRCDVHFHVGRKCARPLEVGHWLRASVGEDDEPHPCIGARLDGLEPFVHCAGWQKRKLAMSRNQQGLCEQAIHAEGLARTPEQFLGRHDYVSRPTRIDRAV